MCWAGLWKAAIWENTSQSKQKPHKANACSTVQTPERQTSLLRGEGRENRRGVIRWRHARYDEREGSREIMDKRGGGWKDKAEGERRERQLEGNSKGQNAQKGGVMAGEGMAGGADVDLWRAIGQNNKKGDSGKNRSAVSDPRGGHRRHRSSGGNQSLTPSEATGGTPKLSPPISTIPKLSRSSKASKLCPLQDCY